MNSWLWRELRGLFEIDDGSLPEVWVEFSQPGAVADAFALLRGHAAGYVTPPSEVWRDDLQAEVPYASLENPAAWVAEGRARDFHLCFSGVSVDGVSVPDLGVLVSQMELSIDYRMGEEWGPSELQAFFVLIATLADLDPGTTVELWDSQPAEDRARFAEAWRRWRSAWPDLRP